MRVLCAIRAATAWLVGSQMEMGISPDLVTSVLTALRAASAAWQRNQEAAPMVGWPAKGISHSRVKMSIVRLVCSRAGWTKMVSERLNSLFLALG